MTDAELSTLVGFLVAGFAAGVIGHWLDAVVAFIRKG